MLKHYRHPCNFRFHLSLCVLILSILTLESIRSQETEMDPFLNSHVKSDILSKELDPVLLPIAEIYLASENENLTLLTKDGNSEILIAEDMLRNSKEFQNVVLVCNAFYPIQWIYQGDGAPTRMYSSEIRTVQNLQNVSSYEYFSTLVLMPERINEHLTGTYICKGVIYPYPQTSYHLYFSGRFGFPTIRNRIIRIPQNETQVLIPCMTTNPKMAMSFYKIFPKEEASNWTNNVAVTYNPRIGYTIDLTKIENPYGTYYCSVNNQRSFWKIDLVPSIEEDVQVDPAVKLIQLKNFINQTFRCSSKEKVKFTFPNSYEFGHLEYNYNKSEIFPYSGIFYAHSNFPLLSSLKYTKINCITERTRRLLHTWEFSTIGEEELKIKYDKHLQRMLCCSKSGLSPTYEFVKCETKSDCHIKSTCFTNGRCEYPFPPKYVDAPLGCTALEFTERIPTHVAKCSVGETNQIVSIMENIQNNDIVLDENTHIPETELILKLTAIMNEKSEVKFKCSGSLYYFSTNFIFALERIDGTIEYPTSESIEMFESHEPILRTKMDNSIRQITCFAPLTLSFEWRNVSMPIFISEPTRSKTSFSSSSTANSRTPFTRRRLKA